MLSGSFWPLVTAAAEVYRWQFEVAWGSTSFGLIAEVLMIPAPFWVAGNQAWLLRRSAQKMSMMITRVGAITSLNVAGNPLSSG
jgi:hypothetical protein